jgi:hypothetical protein
MSTQNCPNCGKPAEELLPIETAMKVALSATGLNQTIPSFACKSCFTELSGRVSQGMRLRLEKEAREQNKLMLWKNRVNLIKQARTLMEQKSYSEAAVAYEKYIRVLEMVYNLKQGELSPAVFNNSKRSKELTVITSVYWDLMRIYDTSPRYGSRMAQSASKLAQFLPLSPIYPDVIKKAELFARSAKNPNVVKGFLKACRVGHGRCFIATAVFADAAAPEVVILRSFRDQYLIPSPAGRNFVHWYYRHSPPVASWLRRHQPACRALRPFFRLIALAAKKSLKSRLESYDS